MVHGSYVMQVMTCLTTWHRIPKDSGLNSWCHENAKSHQNNLFELKYFRMLYDMMMSLVPEPHMGYAECFDESSGCANIWLL
jgi:hypothetical protein